MNRNEELTKYLANKHQGGENNQKGGLYEDYYAVYQIVACLDRYMCHLDAVSFTTQLADTFVDDFLIVLPTKKVYHQLKNTKVVSWGKTDVKGDIAFDFSHQIEDCKCREEDFSLKLVFSAEDTKIGETIPLDIKDFTITERFPFMSDINHLVMTNSGLKECLRRISVEGDDATDDLLSNIATVFLGVWKSFGDQNSITLTNIIESLQPLLFVNLKIFSDEKISDDCKAILDAIEGIKYFVKGKYFYWNVGAMKGVLPWPDKYETLIIERHPNKIKDFITLL